MYHICYSNPEAWQVSYEEGIYGNVYKTSDNLVTTWGKIIDLLALKAGDKVFFYIKDHMCLFGLFEIVNEPYFCQNNVFKDSNQNYPYRFNFKESKHFPNPIPVYELAKLIENGLLSSLTSFERDTNATFRGIRQLSKEEGFLLEDTLLKYNPKGDISDVKVYSYPKIEKTIEAKFLAANVIGGEIYKYPVKIQLQTLPTTRVRRNVYTAQYEKPLQGYVFYCLRRELNNVINDLDLNNFSECLMEVPLLKAQQFRPDVLCLFREELKKPHFYSIIEIKRNKKISINDLSQLIGYMKTFAESKGISFNFIEGLYISSDFEDDAISYLINRNNVEKENPIRLIKYLINENGEVSFSNIVK